VATAQATGGPMRSAFTAVDLPAERRRARADGRAARGFAARATGHPVAMAGSLGLGVALFVIGLLGLLFFPWGGVVLVVIGLVIIVAFLLGFGKRAAEPR
jgi:hypothetical protein